MADNKTYLPDLRIDRGAFIGQKIGQRGMSTLLAKSYSSLTDAATVAKFYNGADFGVEIGAEIPIPYGKVLVRGYTHDSGTIRSDLDPSQIIKVYNFIQGEGPVKGIVGVGEEKLQNVIIGCEAVVDKETGKASKHNIGLKEIGGLALGGALMAAPYIAKLLKKDPVTGQTIPTALSQLPDVSSIMDVGNSLAGNQLAVVDPATGKLTTKSLGDLLRDEIEIINKCCVPTESNTDLTETVQDIVGAMVTGNVEEGIAVYYTDSNGKLNFVVDGEDPGPEPEPEPEAEPDCNPVTFDLTRTIDAPPKVIHPSFKLLPHNGSNKVYAENISLQYPGTFKLHFMSAGLKVGETTVTTMNVNDPAFTGTMAPQTTHCESEGLVELGYCLVINDEIVKSGSLIRTGFSPSNFSFSVDFEWEIDHTPNNCGPNTIREYPTTPCELRVFRVDDYSSSTDVYFQGYSFAQNTAENIPPLRQATPVQPTTPEPCSPPIPEASYLKDDEIGPQKEPAGGTYKDTACGVLPPPETPDDPDEPGEEPEEPGTPECEPCIEIKFKSETGSAPTIAGDEPRDKIYDPAAPAAVKLPVFTVTAEAEGNVTVVFTVSQGVGALSCTTVTAPVSSTWAASSKTLTLVGPLAAVNSTLASLHYQPGTQETADVKYSARVTDGAGTEAMANGVFNVLNKNLSREAKAAETEITLAGSTGNVTAYVNGVAISAAVPYTTSLSNTAQLLVASINDTTSTPNYSATFKSGSTLIVQAPPALGYDANGFQVTVQSSGNITITGGRLDGGVTAAIEKIGLGTRLKDFALGILPTLGSGLLAYTVMNMVAQNSVEVPQELDEPDLNISILLQGRIVRVPNNYNAETRVYTGDWDGVTFADAFTDNPAWCLLDFIENKRYGCGNQIRLTSTQLARLYSDIYLAALRCDESVSNGRGGQEPRYTINTLIAGLTRLEALDAIAGCMHAQPIFTVDGLRIVQDRPQTPIGVVTNANVTSQGFSHAGGMLDSTYNYVDVTYNNPDKYYIPESLFVTDTEDLLARGFELRNSTTAFGVTAEGQAKRHGAWVIQTEKTNPSIVSYTAGFDHEHYVPGDLVYIVVNDDELAKGTNTRGGRFIGKASNTVYTLDRMVTGTLFKIMKKDGTMAEVVGAVAEVAGKAVLTLETAVDAAVGAIWACVQDAEDVAYKLISISEGADGLFAVTAVKHDSYKYDNIDALALS